MKKLYTLAIFTMASGAIFAQSSQFKSRSYENAPTVPTMTEAVVDTIFGPLFCNPSGTTYTLTGLGYVTGTNQAGVKEYGTVAYASQAYKASSFYTVIPRKEIVANGNIYAHLYSFDTATLSVGALLGTSSAVSVSSLDTTNLGWTEFSFTNGPVLNGFFAMTVDAENGGDTVAIMSSQAGASCSGGYTIAKKSDDSFDFLANMISGADMWLWMFLSVDDNVSTEEHILGNNSVNAFPSPANDNINITYNLNGNSEVVINIMDIQGRVVMTATENQTEGRQFVEMNTSALSAGTYFYSVQGGSEVMSGKFVVRH